MNTLTRLIARLKRAFSAELALAYAASNREIVLWRAAQ